MTMLNTDSANLSSSELHVPNGSEPKTGRPAVATDDQLLALATQLHSKLGRAPRADELIAAAGGCQKQRALETIRKLKTKIAQSTVRQQIRFPDFIEQGLRALQAQWLDHAATQLADSHRERLDSLEGREASHQAYVEEQAALVARLHDDLLVRDHSLAKANARVAILEEETMGLRRCLVEMQVLAEERLRMLERGYVPASGPKHSCGSSFPATTSRSGDYP